MAIKGKSKGKSAKAVTPGPKPAYVPVKRPLLARRGLWITAAVVVGIGIVAGLWYGFAKERNQANEQELLAARAAAATAYTREVEPIIGTVGQPVSPANWTHFAELETALANLETGDGKDAEIAATADAASGTAQTAWKALDAVDAAAIVGDKGLDLEFVIFITSSKDRLEQSLKLYEQAAELVKMAADAEGTERTDLILRARGVLDVASALFDDGYSDYVQAQLKAETFVPPNPTAGLPSGPTGFPALTGATGATGAAGNR